MLNCCICVFWKPIGDDHVAATNRYYRFNAPAVIPPHQLSRKVISGRDKTELGKHAMPLRAFQPIHPVTNSLWICTQAKRRKTKR